MTVIREDAPGNTERMFTTPFILARELMERNVRKVLHPMGRMAAVQSLYAARVSFLWVLPVVDNELDSLAESVGTAEGRRMAHVFELTNMYGIVVWEMAARPATVSFGVPFTINCPRFTNLCA